LLSAVNVIVGLSHIAVRAVKARSGMDRFTSESENSRFALRANLVSSPPVQSLATPQKPADTLLVSGRQFSARLALPLLFFGKEASRLRVLRVFKRTPSLFHPRDARWMRIIDVPCS
jgi:hypothetical protein